VKQLVDKYPLVSIVIPVFNKGNFIRETLESALSQTYQRVELVLINDGSTDDSLRILSDYAVKYPHQIRLIDSPNRGVSAATNLGIQAAKGDYIQFLDADDLLSPDKIERQLALLQGHGSEVMATCEWLNFSKDRSQSASVPYGVFREFASGLDLLLRFWNYQEMHQPGVYLTHRSLIEKAGPWREDLQINQDGEFFARVLVRAGKVVYEPQGKVYYRKPGASNVSQQKGLRAMSDLLHSYQAYEAAALPREDSHRIRLALNKVYQKFIYDVYPHHPALIQQAEQRMKKLGIDELTLIGGPKFQLISRYLGFKNALRLKRMLKLS
jgi:glycosyltransferase involved in cell wall biosynthesis